MERPPAASYMAHLADGFARIHRGRGIPLDFTPESIPVLDACLGTLGAGRLPPQVLHTVAWTAGAYIGEVLVRRGRARWSWDCPVGPGAPVLELAPDWETVMLPVDKVAKRLELGLEHLVTPFFQLGLTGNLHEVPPWVRVQVRALPGVTTAREGGSTPGRARGT